MKSPSARRSLVSGCTVHGFSAAVVLQAAVFGLLAPVSHAQVIEFPSPIDFGLVDIETEVSTEQVVHGRVLLYGQVDLDLLQDLALNARSALSMLCSPQTGDAMGMLMPVTSYITQDILTLNQRIVGFRIDFRMLPALDGGLSCADRVSEMTAGPQEPPFFPSPEPPFRLLLAWEMAQHRPTMDVDISDWRVTVVNITCDEIPVLKPVDFPDAIPSPLDGRAGVDRECNGEPMPEVDWAALAEQAWQSPGEKCQYAPNACVCAAIPSCGWFPTVGSGGQCRSGGSVSCDYCPIQAGCEPDPETLCAAETSPCPCVASTGDCYWNSDYNVCLLKEPNKFTSCSDCARQAFCPAVQVENIRPRPLSVMGQLDAGWSINVTFSRQVWLVSSEALVRLQCRTPSGAITRLSVPYEQLSVVAETLFVDLTTLLNSYIMDCDLTIGSGSLRDRDHIPFLGYDAGLYTITLPDTAPPGLMLFEPANSATEIPVDVTVEIIFNEEVVPGPDVAGASIILMGLGAERADGTRQADVEVARLPMDGSSVSFDGRRVLVDLAGHLQAGVLYSLSIPSGAIADESGNLYEGLDTAVYAFRTVTEDQTIVVDEGRSTEVIIGISVAAGAVVISTLLGTWVCMRIRSMRQKMEVYDQETVAATHDPSANFLWGGEKVVGKQAQVLQVGPASPKAMQSSQSLGAASPKGMQVQVLQVGPASPKSAPDLTGSATLSPKQRRANLAQSEPLSPLSPKQRQAKPGQSEPLSPKVARPHPHMSAARAAWAQDRQQPSSAAELGAAARSVGRGSPAPPQTAPPVAHVV